MITASELPSNRTLFIVDNYRLLCSLPSESVDLITTDPPFAKQDTFVGKLKPHLSLDELAAEKEMLAGWGIRDEPDASKAGVVWPTGETTAKFTDIWSWESDVHEEWINRLADTHPHVLSLIDTIRLVHSDSTAAYITYMAVRLIECHRVLKPTGSMYLHCDHHAVQYLRVLLDAVFGYPNFRNEIVWLRDAPGKGAKRMSRQWPRVHDNLLSYSKTGDWTFTQQYTELTEKQKTAYRYKEGRRRYKAVQLGDYSDASIKAMRAQNLIHVSNTGKEYKKYFLDVAKATVGSIWSDIPGFGVKTSSKERTGYPTQKPQDLAKRIISASSDPGDVVLDPFAGCAYTAVAAEELGRRWIACDISARALTVLRRQFAKKHWSIDGVLPAEMLPEETMADLDVTVKGPQEIPERDPSPDTISLVKPLPPRKFKVPASDMPEQEMKTLLAEVAGFQCWACGFAARDIEGEIVGTTEHFHLDHIEPKSQGGSNFVHNRALLCAPCNSTKSNRRIPLKAFRDDPTVAVRRKSYGFEDYPVDIDVVQTAAMFRWSAWRAENGLDEPGLSLG